MGDSTLVFNIFARDHASKVFKDIGKAASNLGKSFDKLQTAGKFAVIGGSAMTAIPQVLALTNAIVSVAPAAYTIVPAALAGGVALGTLKLAMHGVSDALGNLGSDSKSAKKFDAALKSMAPNARSFAVEMKRLYPTLVAVQKVVQNTAFRGLAAQLKPLAANLLPTVRLGLTGVAQAGNTATLKLAAFFRTGQAKSLLGTALQGIVTAFKSMQGIPAKLAKSVLQIAVAAMPAFQRLTGAMVGFFNKFASYVNNKSAGGAFTAMINGAIDTLGQLGRVAGNIGSALGGIFRAAGTGATLLDSIERITKAIANAVNSKKGQEVLQKVFDMMSKAGPVLAVGGALAFVIGSIGSALVALAEPAGAIAAAMAGVGAGFAYLYTKSSGLREIVSIVGEKLRDLWSLFVTEGIPALKNFAGSALGAAVHAFAEINAAIQRNRPALEELWMGFKKVAGFVMAVVVPVLGRNLGNTIQALGSWFSFLVDSVARGVTVFNLFLGAVLGSLKGIIHGAAAAFGWIPDIGKKLHEAETKFDAFAGHLTYSITNIPDEIALKTSTPGSKEALGELGKLDTAVRKVPDAKATKISTPGSVNVKLELSVLKIGLDRLKDKIIGLKTRGVPVTAADLNSIKVKAEALERTFAVKVRVDGGTAAAASLNAVKAAAERMERVYTVTTVHNEQYALSNRQSFPQRAAGGPVRAGQPYIVGENRPELFVPSQNGVIMPRVPGPSSGGSSGGGTARLYIHLTGDDQDLVKRVRKMVRLEGGGDVQVAFGT